MMWKAWVFVAAATAGVFAQDAATTSSFEDSSTASTTSASTTSSQPVTHTVAVAQGGFTFSPDVTLADVGDIIEFDFYPTNHSVIRAEYGYPCIPYEDTGVDKIGFFSGFRPVDAILDDPPKYSIRVNDSNPVFFYCGAPGSCILHQMVGVINPNATTSLVTQKKLAGESTFMLVPGQAWPSEEDDPFMGTTSSSSAAPTATSTKPSASAAATTSAVATPSKSSSLSSGAIAGIAIGAAVVALAAAVLLYMCGRNSRRGEVLPFHPNQHVSYVPSHQGHMSYVDPNKHMSMQSNYMSSALPGYVPQHDSTTSPPLHSAYPPSEALNPGSEVGVPASPSPSQSHVQAAPAYPSGATGNITSIYSNTSPHQSGIYPAPIGVHEMAAPDSQQDQPGSSVNRRSSINKSGIVERYG